jgi:DNA-binding transcriptional LysR family regulator
MRKDIPNLGALQAFEASARLGSFTRAAAELALTQSAVGRQVAMLEQRLGVPLFSRVRRRLTLTDVGREYARASAATWTRFAATRWRSVRATTWVSCWSWPWCPPSRRSG